MKLYHIIGWADINPVIIASSAFEAGEKYINKYGLDFLPMPSTTKNAPRDVAGFGDPTTFPKEGDPLVSQVVFDDICGFFVEPICLKDPKCVECRDGFKLAFEEDIQLIAQLLEKQERTR